MDPLSVAASIISVAGALYAVSRKLRSYAKTISYAEKEVKAIAKEVNLFSILLHSLQYTYDTLTSRVSQSADLLKLCEQIVALAKENVEEFKVFLKALNPLRSSRGEGLISRAVARLKWAYQRSDLVLLRARLESSKSTLNLCMVSIQTMIMSEVYVAALERGEDETETRRLKHQVRMLKSQLRNQRSVVKDAIAASQKIERLIRDKVKSSVNLEVANEALGLAKKQLDAYSSRDSAQVYPQHVFTAPKNASRLPSPLRVPSPPPGPNKPSPLPSPIIVPSPPPAPSNPANPSSPPRPPVSTVDAGRRMSTVAVDTTPSGMSVPHEPSQYKNRRAKRPRRGVPPMSGGVGVDMGYRTASAFVPRGQRGSRVRDGNRNIGRKHHEGDG